MGLFKNKNKKEPVVESNTTKTLERPSKKSTITQQIRSDNKLRGVSINRAASLAIQFDASHTTHFEPISYDETKEIADILIRFKEVMINFNKIINKEEKRRVIDFLTGIMYALNGDYDRVEKGIYYFTIAN